MFWYSSNDAHRSNTFVELLPIYGKQTPYITNKYSPHTYTQKILSMSSLSRSLSDAWMWHILGKHGHGCLAILHSKYDLSITLIKFRNLEKWFFAWAYRTTSWPMADRLEFYARSSSFSLQHSSIHIYMYVHYADRRKKMKTTYNHIWLYSLSLVGILWSAEIQSQVDILH